MTYSIYILKNGSWVSLNVGDETIPLVLQVNDLANLKDSNASFSREVKIPMDVHNREVFDYAEDLTSHSIFPYRVYECRVYFDGREVLGSGYRLEVLGIDLYNKSFSVQIVSTIREIFNELAELPLEDLDLGWIDWTIDVVKFNITRNMPYRFMLSAINQVGSTIDLHSVRLAGWTGITPPTNIYSVQLSQIQPYYGLIDIVKAIIENQGYTMQTSIESIAGYEKVYLSMGTMTPREDSFDRLASSLRRTYTITATDTFPKPILIAGSTGASTFQYNEISYHTGIKDPEAADDEYTNSGIFYSATGATSIKVVIEPGTYTSADTIKFRVRRIGGLSNTSDSIEQSEIRDIIEDVDLTGTELDEIGGVWKSSTIDMSPGECIFIEMNWMIHTGVANIGTAQVSIDFSEAKNVIPGGRIYPDFSTAFSNQQEVIKEFVQLYCLTPTVDEANKVIRFVSLDELIDTIDSGDTVDWTEKVVADDTETVRYKYGSYARENGILFQPNKLLDDYQDKGIMTIDNESLSDYQDLFTLKSTSSDNVDVIFPTTLIRPTVKMLADPKLYMEQYIERRYQIYFNKFYSAPLYTYRDSRTQLVKANPIDTGSGTVYLYPPVMYMKPTSSTDPSDFYDMFGSPSWYASAFKAQDFVDTYYKTLVERILNRVKSVNLKFNLTIDDIQAIDFFKPVYLHKYGGYFYINNINNFVAKQVTEATILAINYLNTD